MPDNQQVTNEDLQRLVGLMELQQVRLPGTGIDDGGLVHIAQCASLEYLALGRTGVTNAGLSLLLELPLTSLIVDHIGLTQEGLDAITSIATLEYITIATNDVAALDLGVLSALPELESLGIHDSSFSDADVDELSALTNLTLINVGKTDLTADGLARLQEMLPDCRIIHESNADQDRAAAEFILRNGGTVLVNLLGELIWFGEGEALPTRPFSLLWIQLQNVPTLTDADMNLLEGLPSLSSLSLTDSPIGDVGVRNLGEIPQLQVLGLNGTAITDDGLSHIVSFPQLTHLYLGRTDVTSAGLVHLRDLQTLEYLNLQRTRIDGTGLVHLQQLASLEELNLAQNLGITGDGLEFVAALPKLKRLKLFMTSCGDEGLVKLANMAGLEDLDVTRTNVTADGIARLREALPDCRIVHESIPSSNDRAVAEWVQSIGGSGQLEIEGKLSVVGFSPDEPLPAETFTIRSVGLNANQQIRNEDLQRLVGLSELVQLRLIETGIGDEGLRYVSQCRSLEMLYLGATDVSNAGLSLLRELPLTLLAVDRIGLTQEGLDHVSRVVTLENLNIAQQGLAPLDLRVLSALPHLTHLGVHNSNFGDGDVEELAALTNLTLINVGRTDLTAEGIARLGELLPDCRIIHESISDPDREVAEWVLEQGGNVWIGVDGVPAEATGVSKLPDGPFTVDVINLDNREFPTEELSRIAELQHGVRLNLENTATTVDDLRWISAFDSLVTLQMQGTDIGDELLALVPESPQLVILTLSGAGVTDEGLRHVGRFGSAITQLRLGRAAISDTGVAALNGLDQLLVLFLRATGVTDEGLPHLSNLPRLSYLDLGVTQVSDVGVPHLADVPRLAWLSLSDTTVSDACIPALSQMNRLWHLNLDRTNVSGDGALRLQAALPGCAVIHPDVANISVEAGPETRAILHAMQLGGTVVLRDESGTESSYDDVEGLPAVLDEYSLVGMDLSSTPVVSYSFQVLQNAPALEEMDLSDTEFDGSLNVLTQNYPQLKRLVLRNCRIDDAGLRTIRSLPLEEVDVRGTDVTQEGITRFLEVRPNCRINWDGGTLAPEDGDELSNR